MHLRDKEGRFIPKRLSYFDEGDENMPSKDAEININIDIGNIPGKIYRIDQGGGSGEKDAGDGRWTYSRIRSGERV